MNESTPAAAVDEPQWLSTQPTPYAAPRARRTSPRRVLAAMALLVVVGGTIGGVGARILHADTRTPQQNVAPVVVQPAPVTAGTGDGELAEDQGGELG